MIRVLSVASECVPLVKTGGLADVVGALPAALKGAGVEMRVLLPGYPAVLAALEGSEVLEEVDAFGGRLRLLAGRAAGLDLLVLEAPHLYDRPGGPYLDPQGRDWADNDARFAALSWTGARIGAQGAGGWMPDVLHGHDWQAGLMPVYLKDAGHDRPTVLTVHNIAFHGLTAAARMGALRLPAWAFHPDGFEFYGQISALKAGLVHAWRITAVSPTFARELATPEHGAGLDGVIRSRGGDVRGILNGIDTASWDPMNDPAISGFKSPNGKAANRSALMAECGLVEAGGPLAVVVSRLSDQKGLDLLLAALPAFLAQGGQLALLGSGDRRLEHAWLAAAEAHPGQVSVKIGYDEALSHRFYAGADAVLVPSRFEPCGLTQMYGLRYGAIPVVARTGGLADTVIHANAAALTAGCATGLVHDPQSVPALEEALRQLCALHAQPAAFRQLQKNAMKHKVGWEASAPLYAALYARLADSHATEKA